MDLESHSFVHPSSYPAHTMELLPCITLSRDLVLGPEVTTVNGTDKIHTITARGRALLVTSHCWLLNACYVVSPY